jgi:hypothetical protein
MSFLKCNIYGENYEKLLTCNAGSVVQAVGLVFSLCYFSRNKARVYGSVILVGYYKIWLRRLLMLLMKFN